MEYLSTEILCAEMQCNKSAQTRYTISPAGSAVFTRTRVVMCGTYISCGLNLWMRAQRATPLFHEDVQSVMVTFL